jgi:Lysine-specific metallo-endopeptidase
MSFELRSDVGKSAGSSSAAGHASTPGKQTLTSMVEISGASSASTVKAEAGTGGVRAQIGALAEGSHPGVKRGGGGKRKIGNIVAGTFVRDAAPAAGGPAAAAGGPGAAAAPASPTAATGHDSDRAYVGGTSSHVADRTTSDGTTSVQMADESDAQAAMISAAVTRARAILDNAVGKIGSPTDPKVAAALQANFHSTDAKVVTEVASKLSRIRSAFSGTIPVEVESEGTARAYVYVIWSDIHLCPPWFADADPDGRARTIIHECSHKYTGTDDKAYHWDGKYQTLSTKDALDNADSYAWFCIDVL